MKIHSVSQVHHAVDPVYQAYRDRLSEIASYIPDVREIQVLSREDTPAGPKLLNLWIADREVPKVLRPVLKPEMMRWKDHAQWVDEERYVDWDLVIPAFEKQVRCKGRNTFRADGDGASTVTLEGELEIHLDKVPGVPGFVARRLAPKIEEFIVKLVTPNLVKVNESLQTFLDDQGT